MSNPNHKTDVLNTLKIASRALHDLSKRSPLIKLNIDKSIQLKDLDKIMGEINSVLSLEITTPSTKSPGNHRLQSLLMSNQIGDQQKKEINALINRANDRFRIRNYQTLHLTFGTITTDELHAPLILLRVRLIKNKDKSEFFIERHGNVEVNPALIRIMEEASASSTDRDRVSQYIESIGQIDSTANSDDLKKQLNQLHDTMRLIYPRSEIDLQTIWMTNLSFTNDLIIRDIDTIISKINPNDNTSIGSLDKLFQKEETPVKKSLFQWYTERVDRLQSYFQPSVDHITPYLILNSDSSQRKVIADVIAGNSVCVQGPPGTGKSQTIANLIAVLIANKKRVLFVAEKDAAIEAVTKHLNGLSDLYLYATEQLSTRKFNKEQENRQIKPSVSPAEAQIAYTEWATYLRTSAQQANVLRDYMVYDLTGKKPLTDAMNTVFTPNNSHITLFWNQQVWPIVNKLSWKHIGIWGFWNLWGIFYTRMFLGEQQIASVLNGLKKLPTSSEPSTIINSLPIGIRGLVKYLNQLPNVIHIDEVVLYHLQRMFIHSQLPTQQLSQLESKLKSPPKWASAYYEYQDEQRKYEYKSNIFAQSMVIHAQLGDQTQVDRSKNNVPCVITTPSQLKRFFDVMTTAQFDVVIIDEASQMRPESAIGAFYRADQYVVFGDENQLPPTSFGSAYSDDENDVTSFASNNYTELTRITGESTLSWASKATVGVSPMLEFFYRGSEQLITASNTHFYKGAIKSFPQSSGSAVIHHLIQPGINKETTDSAIFEQVLNIWTQARTKKQSVLVIASGIERKLALERYMKRKDFSDESNIELTSIEEVQGNQASCVVFFFDHPEFRNDGNINLTKFGPINNQGGERRLNVAFTRAEKEMHIVTSFGAHQIDTSSGNAAHKFLKRYLEIANQNDIQPKSSATKITGWEQHFAELIPKLAPSITMYHSYGSSEQPITWIVRSRNSQLAYDTDLGRFTQASFDIRDELIRRQQMINFGWGKHSNSAQSIDLIDVHECLHDINSIVRRFAE